MNVTNILTKTLGYGALALIAYDSHTLGKIEASSLPQHIKAEELSNSYMHNLSQGTPSVVQSKLKETIFKLRVNENISSFFTGIYGYAKGFGKMLINNVLPLALAVGTVCTKGIFSKVFGAGLLAYGGIYLIQNAFGIGNKH